MANYTVTSFRVTTTSATAAYQDIGQSVVGFSGLEILAETEESHAMGDSWAETLPTGLKRVSNITLDCLYDDAAATGTATIFGNATDAGAERVIKVGFGTANVFPKMDVIVKRASKKPSRGALTRLEVELIPTGAVTIATT